MLGDTKMNSVVFTEKAFLSVVAETYERFSTETGGIFLGKFVRGKWYVLEALDPGPNSIFTPAYFEYDTPYVNHLANKIERFYKQSLELIGLWHRHPGNYSTFSSTDDSTNIKYASQNTRGAISAIVNLVPDFKMTMYYVSLPLKYTTISYDVNDALIPSELKELKHFSDFRAKEGAPAYSRFAVRTHKAPIPKTETKWSLLRMIKNYRQRNRSIDQPRSTSLQEELMDMIDNEFAYLDKQDDYNYKIKMNGNEIVISMDYMPTGLPYPKTIQFIFGQYDQEGYVIVNGDQYSYSPGFIQKYID